MTSGPLTALICLFGEIGDRNGEAASLESEFALVLPETGGG